MHVCWSTTDGKNCNLCEKCARTLLYILSKKENPNDYGFNIDNSKLLKMEKILIK